MAYTEYNDLDLPVNLEDGWYHCNDVGWLHLFVQIKNKYIYAMYNHACIPGLSIKYSNKNDYPYPTLKKIELLAYFNIDIVKGEKFLSFLKNIKISQLVKFNEEFSGKTQIPYYCLPILKRMDLRPRGETIESIKNRIIYPKSYQKPARQRYKIFL